MRTRTLAVLMATLSLAAAALLGADADDADLGLIRLPTDRGEGLAGNEVTLAAEAVAEAWKEIKKGGEEDAAPAATEKSFGVVGGGEDETTRPWACCNQTRCTKSFPPTCHCLDVVDKCDGACKKCEPAIMYPLRFVCNDEFHGDPGPKCPGGDDDDVPSGASRSLPAAAALFLLACVVLVLVQSQ
uniref:Uncharacterized protein n=1 Tax=Avena sativa TaxID=4498 RepID=A0ACD5TQ91_AVESA